MIWQSDVCFGFNRTWYDKVMSVKNKYPIYRHDYAIINESVNKYKIGYTNNLKKRV
jgi:hypothetical protein